MPPMGKAICDNARPLKVLGNGMPARGLGGSQPGCERVQPVVGFCVVGDGALAAHLANDLLADPAFERRRQLVGRRVAQPRQVRILGQRKRLPVVVDASASGFDTVFCSAGRRGLEVELAPAELVRLTAATVAPIAVGA